MNIASLIKKLVAYRKTAQSHDKCIFVANHILDFLNKETASILKHISST